MRRRLRALLLGTIFTLVALELGLRATGAVFQGLQARANRARTEAESADEVRVICIGESTTAVAGDETGHLLVTSTAWPAQMEAELNRDGGRRFHVYNFGAMGGTSWAVLERLTAEAPEIHPTLVIAMMGLKDSRIADASGTDLGILDHLSTVKLLKWSIEAVRLREGAAPTDVDSADQIPASLRAQAGQTAFVRETRLLPGAAGPHADAERDALTVAIYYWDLGRYAEAERRLRDLIATDGLGYNVLAFVLEMDAREEDALAALREGIAAHPEEGAYRVTLAELLTRAGRYDEAQATLDEAATVPLREPALMATLLRLQAASVARERGQPERALELLGATEPPAIPMETAQWFPRPDIVWHLEQGQALSDLHRWPDAEAHLTLALSRLPGQGAVMWTLAEVYRQSGQAEKEAALRQHMVAANERMADYYELAKVLTRNGQAAQVPAVYQAAAERIPGLAANYRRLYDLAESQGFRLIVMQYPAFPMSALHTYAPEHPGVRFVDNEHLFDADPDRYFFEPQFPFSFSHYTRDGAALLAHQAAEAVRAELAEGG